MRVLAVIVTVVLALGLAACGGGVEVGVVVGPPPPPDFEIGVLLDGSPLPGVDVFPGDVQTLYVAVGQDFELHSSGPVDWTVVAGGNTIPGSGGTIFYGGAALQETRVSAFQFDANASAPAPLTASVSMRIYATSLDDSSQVAVFDLVITN